MNTGKKSYLDAAAKELTDIHSVVMIGPGGSQVSVRKDDMETLEYLATNAEDDRVREVLKFILGVKGS